MGASDKFNFAFFFYALTGGVREPRRFFSDLPPETGLKQPLGFLLVTCLFFTIASLVRNMSPNPLFGGVLLVNAIGMVFISAGIGYMLMIMFMGKKAPFSLFFSIYAFSSGVTLLVSWIPFFVWITELWKWWLIGTGMVQSLGFKNSQVFWIVGLSVVMLVLFFWSAVAVCS